MPSRRKRKQRTSAALQHALSLLNGRNLEHLWKVAAALSLYEHRFPLEHREGSLTVIHHVKTRLLPIAILLSNAKLEDLKTLQASELRQITNDLGHMMDDPDGLATLQAHSGQPTVRRELHRYMARLATTQIADQEQNFPMRAGRLIALLQDLPRDYPAYLPDRQRLQIDSLIRTIPDYLGATVRELADAFTLVLSYMESLLPPLSAWMPPIPSEERAPERRAAAFGELLEGLIHTSYQDLVVLTPEKIQDGCNDQNLRRTTGRLLDLFSKSSAELRRLQKEVPFFSYGHPTTRLSPFDRYPVVSLPGSHRRYIIPNSRIFEKSFGAVIDYHLLETEAITQDYLEARGGLQEVYLRRLLEERLGHLTLIPEQVYGKQHLRGPDLVLIDNERRRLILIESKARRIRADTRTTLSDELIDDNIRGAYEALALLPDKISALYSGGLEIYSRFQAEIDRTRHQECYCVVVLADQVFAMSELIRSGVAANEEHPLREFPYKYSVLGIESFELAVETAAQSDQPLVDLLDRHWEESMALDANSPPADDFGRYNIDVESTFAASFFLS